jgi:hypothetical protein
MPPIGPAHQQDLRAFDGRERFPHLGSERLNGFAWPWARVLDEDESAGQRGGAGE